MNEFLLYINTLKQIIDRNREKETVFYNDGRWYSRDHSDYITPEEIAEWVLRLSEPKWYEEVELKEEEIPMTFEQWKEDIFGANHQPMYDENGACDGTCNSCLQGMYSDYLRNFHYFE